MHKFIFTYMGIIWLSLVTDSFSLPQHRLVLIGKTIENVKLVSQHLKVTTAKETIELCSYYYKPNLRINI